MNKWFFLPKYSFLLLLCSPLLIKCPDAFAGGKACHFIADDYNYEGSALEQARCLWRPVGKGGRIPETPDVLPAPMEALIGETVLIDKLILRDYLIKQDIAENDLGGSLDEPLSYANDGDSSTRPTSYFVMHDTSAPDYGKKAIPNNINSPAWKYNQLWRYPDVAHVFINRLGASQTKVNFDTPFRATKFESKVLQDKSKGLFLHIEMLQPRKDQPKLFKKNNQLLAPMPGFTKAQYSRLALVYTMASVRSGKWLIPSFHAVIDHDLYDAHDDPQNFNREQFAAELNSLLKTLSTAEIKNAQR